MYRRNSWEKAPLATRFFELAVTVLLAINALLVGNPDTVR